jgi:hypothetical protein
MFKKCGFIAFWNILLKKVSKRRRRPPLQGVRMNVRS